jgi:hypothetical protein
VGGGVRCKAYLVAPCGEVRGDEEGYWRAEEDGTYTWHLQACVLRRFSHGINSKSPLCSDFLFFTIAGTMTLTFENLCQRMPANV